MTCIVGLVEKISGRVYIGADSAGVDTYSYKLQIRADEKVFTNGPTIMGFTSSFRMGQLLRWKLKIPKHPNNMTVSQYMSSCFIDAVRNCLKKGGFAKKKDETEEGGTFLVGYSGHLFQICDDYQVAESALNFDAIGSGGSVALGSLHTTSDNRFLVELTCEERVLMALKAAESLNAGVRGPFLVQNVDPDGQRRSRMISTGKCMLKG